MDSRRFIKLNGGVVVHVQAGGGIALWLVMMPCWHESANSCQRVIDSLNTYRDDRHFVSRELSGHSRLATCAMLSKRSGADEYQQRSRMLTCPISNDGNVDLSHT